MRGSIVTDDIKVIRGAKNHNGVSKIFKYTVIHMFCSL